MYVRTYEVIVVVVLPLLSETVLYGRLKNDKLLLL